MAKRKHRRASREHGGATGEHRRAQREHKGATSEYIDETGFSGGAQRRDLSQRSVTCYTGFGEDIYIKDVWGEVQIDSPPFSGRSEGPRRSDLCEGCKQGHCNGMGLGP